MGAPTAAPIGAILAAKQAGTAGVKEKYLLELCVQCPASVLRALSHFCSHSRVNLVSDHAFRRLQFKENEQCQ